MAVTQITASMLAPLRGDKRWAYIERQKTIRVVTIDEDGSPYLSPLWFVVDEQRIFLPLDAGGRHAKNAEAGRPFSALVDTGDEFTTVAGVRMLGTLKATDDPTLIERLSEKVFDKYFHVGHPFAEGYMEFGNFAGRRWLEIIVDKMIGWDQRETSTSASYEARVLPSHIGDRLLPGS
ncbi:unannotated protein [freshwater metagenome]|uniref:Unannotated protein n=1 Tax=freshwater metagenome TaxID=449393 RepID=A0A6J7CUE5_9ZZZZ|nr:pyridoxamine 5'-phosphate oxidase family protein [Actinomycetota bacterium]